MPRKYFWFFMFFCLMAISLTGWAVEAMLPSKCNNVDDGKKLPGQTVFEILPSPDVSMI